ncbi:MAG: hypothetical protein FWG42_10600 [Clostridiales bacterium]|nr:hypothetical protein [Clostridiales bacterium]
MRVNELRTALEKYDTAVLKEIIVTLYKAVPKSGKEDGGLDDLIQNYAKHKANATKGKEAAAVDFKALEREIVQFIDYADSQYYLAPNRYVHKDKRSKWRFEVKRFIKELLTISGENSSAAARLLADIYAMLSYATSYYVFRTEVPFSAVGYKQPDLLTLVLGKILYSGYDPEAVKKAVFLTLDSDPDRDTYHVELLYALAETLKTPDAKELALEQCTLFPEEYEIHQSSKTVFEYKYSHWDSLWEHRKREHSNYAAELYLILKFSLHEHDDGIAYFLEHYTSYEKEIVLYCLLRFLSDDDLNHLWIREYEKAVENGISPRDSLAEEYAERKQQ